METFSLITCSSLSEELSYYLQALKQKVNTVQNKNPKYKEHIPPIVIFRLLNSDSLLIISFYPQVITLSDLPEEQKTLSRKNIPQQCNWTKAGTHPPPAPTPQELWVQEEPTLWQRKAGQLLSPHQLHSQVLNHFNFPAA